MEVAEALVRELKDFDGRQMDARPEAIRLQRPVFVYGIVIEDDEVFVQGRLNMTHYSDGNTRKFPETVRVRAHLSTDLAATVDFMTDRMRELLNERV